MFRPHRDASVADTQGAEDRNAASDDSLFLGTDEPYAEVAAYRRPVRRIARLYLVVAAVLVPWTIYLAVSLPTRNLEHYYRLAWVGFDVFLVAVIALTALFAYRVDPRVQLPATATATLLVVDAWFDILTSADRRSLAIAVCFALFLELPGAGLSLYLASRVNDEVDRLAEAHLDEEEGQLAT